MHAIAILTLLAGLHQPQGVTITDDGRIFITALAKAGDSEGGQILLVQNGKTRSFASGFARPRGIVAHNEFLYVADGDKIWKVDLSGKATILAAADAFPSPPKNLASIAVDFQKGTLYVGDSGDEAGNGAAIYRVGSAGSVETIVDRNKQPTFGRPTALLMDGAAFLLMADRRAGRVCHVRLADGAVETTHVVAADGLAWDPNSGRLLIHDAGHGAVLVRPRPEQTPVVMTTGVPHGTGLCVDPVHRSLLIVDSEGGRLLSARITVPGAEVDENPLPLEAVNAFPNLQWADWSPETATGTIAPLRPIVLTHAGDGTNRVFVATQQGIIHVFSNDQAAERSRVFLDIHDRVRYSDKTDEEGFLGLAFPTNYKDTGEVVVFYTPRKANRPHTNVISRFRVRRDDPNQADSDSEQVLLTVEHPFWNHDGGTVAFGPDGYLYIALGDGGAAADPFQNGQNLKTILGKILRIDISKPQGGKPYSIPADNPFVGKDARPEIWCYGLRNVWRFSFDRKTGACWAGDVGQDLWEEIDLLTAGGNYGWSVRESLHPFGARGVGPRKDLIDPIWEYHHSVGKSITGGGVYRGKRLPELDGAYLYADYVSGTVTALRYDPDKRRVIANQPIKSPKLPIVSFGEDETGEIYFLSIAANGRGIYRFERTEKAK